MGRGRVRRWLGFGIVAVGAAVFAVYLASGFWLLAAKQPPRRYVVIPAGTLCITWKPDRPTAPWSWEGSFAWTGVNLDLWYKPADSGPLGYLFYRSPASNRAQGFMIVNLLPVSVLVMLTGAGFIVWGRRARYRSRPGFCRKCGYDRSGIDAEASCPECGFRNRTKRT